MEPTLTAQRILIVWMSLSLLLLMFMIKIDT